MASYDSTDVLKMVGVTMDAYTHMDVRGLSMCSSGNAVNMQRQVYKTWISIYNVNPTCMANEHIWTFSSSSSVCLCHLIIGPHTCSRERSIGELLEQVSKESNVLEIRAQ